MKKLLAIVFFIAGIQAFAQTETVRYAIIPENPRPGEPVTIGASDEGAELKSAALISEGRRLSGAAFFRVPAEGGKQSFMAAVLTVPATARPGRVLISLEGAQGIAAEIALDIAGREFDSEVIELNQTLTGIRTLPDPRKTAEAEHLWAILNTTGNELHCFGRFRPPVESTRRTSFFGSRRVYQYSHGGTDVSVHAGVDYGIPTGTPVSACGPGRVVLARFRIVTGNSVVIEHLPGIYSMYYHLDRIEVSEGALAAAGTLVGLSGATGLATGPHLHWEIRISGENTDPDAFIARPILDKDAILGKIGK